MMLFKTISGTNLVSVNFSALEGQLLIKRNDCPFSFFIIWPFQIFCVTLLLLIKHNVNMENTNVLALQANYEAIVESYVEFFCEKYGFDLKRVNYVIETVNPEIYINKDIRLYFNELKFMVDKEFTSISVYAFIDYLNSRKKQNSK
jgi:hypothetical protein